MDKVSNTPKSDHQVITGPNQYRVYYTLVVLWLLALMCLSGLPGFSQEHCNLRVSENNLYLEDLQGQPVFLNGDTGWNLGIRLEREEIRRYLEVRKSQKFNIIGMAAMFESNHTNVYGHQPMHKTDGKWDPAKPLVTDYYDYWDHIDFAIEEIASRDMYVALVIAFNSWVVGNGRGENREQIVFNEQNAYEYGHWIGNRYKNHHHIIWMMGGDRSPVYGEYDYQAVYHAMAEGVADGIKGHLGFDGQADYSGILMSYHPQKARPASSTWFHQAPWMSFNSIQACPADQTATITQDLALQPPKPTWLFEGRYEQYTFEWKPWQMRFQAYFAIMSGAFGHLYGNRFVWNYDEHWERHLYDPGAMDMTHLFDLFTDFLPAPWYTMKPSAQILTGDPGMVEATCWRNETTAAPYSNLVKAMVSEDNRCLVVYSSDGSSFDVRTNVMADGKPEAFWFDPSSGHWNDPQDRKDYAKKSNILGSLNSMPESYRFDPPGEPGAGNDWLLILAVK